MVVGSEVFEGLDHNKVIFITGSFGRLKPSDVARNGGAEDDDDAKVLDVDSDTMDEKKLTQILPLRRRRNCTQILPLRWGVA